MGTWESEILSLNIFSILLLLLSSTDCGCNQCFHLVPVSCHYYRVHVQNLSVCLSYFALCYCRVKRKQNLFFATKFILNLLVVKHFLSLPSSCTLILELFFLSMMDAECALFYFSMVFNNCFHTIAQDIQLSTLILYLFCYNLLLYHSYDYWIKLYCIKYKLCQRVRL